MPSKTKKLAASAASLSLPTTPKELIDQVVSGSMTGEAVNDACLAFKKALIARALGAGDGSAPGLPGGARPAAADNHRNGSTAKT